MDNGNMKHLINIKNMDKNIFKKKHENTAGRYAVGIGMEI